METASAAPVILGLLIFLGDRGGCLSHKLVEEFNWKELDFEYPNGSDRRQAIQEGWHIPGAAIPTGLDVWADRLFLATPRINPGVPSTLNYISISGVWAEQSLHLLACYEGNDVNTKSPRLMPYPSWEMNQHNKTSKKTKLTSVHAIRIDACQRLWALDTGVVEELTAIRIETPPIIFVFNLIDNTLVRKYTLLDTEFDEKSKLRNIVVDSTSGTCENAYAYIADTKHGLIVYSWDTNKSFRINNNYFSFDPIWGNFETSLGKKIQLSDGLFGLALSLPDHKGFRQLIFHSMVGINEFRVSTEIIRNKTLAMNNISHFYLYGNKGPDSQSTASTLELENGIFLYTTIVKNGVSCWNSFKGEELTPENQGTVDTFQDANSFPYDLKVDRNGTLWILTNSLLNLIYDKKAEGIPFHIYSGKVRNIIKGTPCEPV